MTAMLASTHGRPAGQMRRSIGAALASIVLVILSTVMRTFRIGKQFGRHRKRRGAVTEWSVAVDHTQPQSPMTVTLAFPTGIQVGLRQRRVGAASVTTLLARTMTVRLVLVIGRPRGQHPKDSGAAPRQGVDVPARQHRSHMTVMLVS